MERTIAQVLKGDIDSKSIIAIRDLGEGEDADETPRLDGNELQPRSVLDRGLVATAGDRSGKAAQDAESGSAKRGLQPEDEPGDIGGSHPPRFCFVAFERSTYDPVHVVSLAHGPRSRVALAPASRIPLRHRERRAWFAGRGCRHIVAGAPLRFAGSTSGPPPASAETRWTPDAQPNGS